MEPDVNYVTEYHANYDITQEKKEWIVTQDSWQMAVTKTLQICQKADTNKLLKNVASQICWIVSKWCSESTGLAVSIIQFLLDMYEKAIALFQSTYFEWKVLDGRGESAQKARADARLLLSNGILGS